MSILLEKPERWTVKEFGIKKSLMVIGWYRGSFKLSEAYIPHWIYNKIIKISKKLRIDYMQEFKINEYNREYLIFVNIETNKVISKLLIEVPHGSKNKRC